jgi:pyridoxine 4-dehydrogenase
MFSIHEPAEGSIEAPMTVLAELQQEGLVRHLGLSNVTPAQIAEAQQIAPIVCLQNHYNLAHRADDALIADLARDGIAYVPFFPLGGFTPLQSATLSNVAVRLDATPMQVALAWLLQRSHNILVIPGTSSIEHLRENLQASMLQIPSEVLANLDSIGGGPAQREPLSQRLSRRELRGALHLLLNLINFPISDSLKSASFHRF